LKGKALVMAGDHLFLGGQIAQLCCRLLQARAFWASRAAHRNASPLQITLISFYLQLHSMHALLLLFEQLNFQKNV
jgi:hypothetical protein